MHRVQARWQLAQLQVTAIELSERLARILDWWSINEHDSEFERLDPSVQEEILLHDGPICDSADSRYDTLVSIALFARTVGVRNQWLRSQLASHGTPVRQLEGDPETRVACPCCAYLTLGSAGTYEICPECFWEDNGVSDPSEYSGPNHMTLAAGQENFERLGAVNAKARPFVVADPIERYYRQDRDG